MLFQIIFFYQFYIIFIYLSPGQFSTEIEYVCLHPHDKTLLATGRMLLLFSNQSNVQGLSFSQQVLFCFRGTVTWIEYSNLIVSLSIMRLMAAVKICYLLGLVLRIPAEFICSGSVISSRLKEVPCQSGYLGTGIFST